MELIRNRCGSTAGAHHCRGVSATTGGVNIRELTERDDRINKNGQRNCCGIANAVGGGDGLVIGTGWRTGIHLDLKCGGTGGYNTEISRCIGDRVAVVCSTVGGVNSILDGVIRRGQRDTVGGGDVRTSTYSHRCFHSNSQQLGTNLIQTVLSGDQFSINTSRGVRINVNNAGDRIDGDSGNNWVEAENQRACCISSVRCLRSTSCCKGCAAIHRDAMRGVYRGDTSRNGNRIVNVDLNLSACRSVDRVGHGYRFKVIALQGCGRYRNHTTGCIDRNSSNGW